MNKDRIVGLGFLIFCALLWFVIIPQQTEGAEEAFVPRLSVLCVAIPALIMLLHRPRQTEKSDFNAFLFLNSTLPVLILFFLYMLALVWLGFFIPSALFMIASLFLFGERRPKIYLLTPVILLSAVYVVIVYCLRFELPQGLLLS